MKKVLTFSLCVVLWGLGMASVVAMGTAVTYQGRLHVAGDPAEGPYDVQFQLFEDAVAGHEVGLTLEADDLDIVGGYFTVALDFGANVFDGNNRWLQISVRPSTSTDPADYVPLSPRQAITPAPYALYARSGTPGPQGPIGPQGDKGDTGTVGPRGLQGIQGIQGVQGTAGAKGDKGDTGPQGPIGLTGAKGDKGDTGLTGPTGPTLGIYDSLLKTSSGGLAAGNAGGRTLTNLGNVGIGTANPTEELEIYKDQNNWTILKLNNPDSAGSYAGSAIQFRQGNVDRAVIAALNSGNTTMEGGPNSLQIFSKEGPIYMDASPDKAILLNARSSGFVGLGMSNPQAPLHIYSPESGFGMLKLQNSTPGSNEASMAFIPGSDATIDDYWLQGVGLWGSSDDFVIGRAGPRVVITSGGRVSIPTASQYTSLRIGDDFLLVDDIDLFFMNGIVMGDYDGPSGLMMGSGTSDYGMFSWLPLHDVVRLATTGGIWFETGNHFSADVVIDKRGNVGIGVVDPGTWKLFVNGPAFSTGGWLSSDARFKKDVRQIDSPLDKVMDLQGVSFEWDVVGNPDRNFVQGRHYGVIAQQVEQVVPEVVMEGPEGDKAVSYTELVPILIEAIKELKAENDQLRQRVEVLERTAPAAKGLNVKEALQ